MRLDCGSSSETRKALSRGPRVKLLLVAAAAAAILIAPAAAQADAFLSPGLADQAAARPDAVFKVIVQGTDGRPSAAVAADVRALTAARHARGSRLRRSFASISGVSADLSGAQILELAGRQGVLAITADAPVQPTGSFSSSGSGSGLNAPTIAIVDSGIEPSSKNFGNRLLAKVNLTSLPNNSPLDGRGHGTFVASVAAGSADRYAGAAPSAKLVSIDVIDDAGMGLTSDVIAGADWILQNKDRYKIRVANFSLTGSTPSTFRFDPLDRAVEKLWFRGVVVVTAAGNYADTQPGVLYSPGNDPFVITVGAVDAAGTVPAGDDFPAPWSSYGSTLDGFLKPEVSAPGRMLVGAVPSNSTLAAERPDRIVEPGYMAMSGTSFAAAVVSGIAADILALHPTWTPDKVKGALMQSARPLTLGPPHAGGVGEVTAYGAANVADPPNPNRALNRFVVPDPAGGSIPVFDQATWTTAALADPSWDAATWTTATWTTATWTTAYWNAATWTTATWTTATWTTATWTTATWTTATWTTSSDLS